MKLKLTNHLRLRLKQRKVPAGIIREVFNQCSENYWDNLRNHYIVLGKVVYQGKIRKVLVAYDKIGDITEAITIHPITDEQIKQRLTSGRWNYEKSKKEQS